MKRRISAGLAAGTLAIALSAPLVANAASAERSYQIITRIVENTPSVGEFDGSLRLHISADGIVSGYYRPDDNARFISVTGGITGDRFWIDIGSFATDPMRFSGTFNNGTIDASSSRPILDDGRVTGLQLSGKPKAS